MGLALESVRIDAPTGAPLLAAFDLDIASGTFVAVVGPNGAGKTTLLRTLAGAVPPAAGRVRLDGRDLHTLPPAERARAIAALGAEAETPAAMTVREVALAGRFAQHAWWDWARRGDDAAAVEVALARVNLADKADRSFETLSSGERQRAWIALALAQGAGTLLLDEPTSHLDPRYALEILELVHGIAREGTTVVAVLHDLNEAAAFADRIALLGEGRLLAYGVPDDVLEPALLERAYGITFATAEAAGGRRVFATRAGARELPRAHVTRVGFEPTT